MALHFSGSDSSRLGARPQSGAHYLANHQLTDYTGPCNVVAAREGLAWLRERYRERGERAPI